MNFSRFFLEELFKNFPIAQVVNRLLPLAKVLCDSFFFIFNRLYILEQF